MSDSTTPMSDRDDPRAAVRPERPVQVHPTLRLSVDPPDDNEFDALADLFLGDDEHPPSAQSPTTDQQQAQPTAHQSAQPTIEAIVLGHLPVLASAWVRQYAAHRADELGGPVVLIRVRASGTSIEQLPAGPAERCERLSDALSASLPGALGVVLQVDETAEPDLGTNTKLDAITLLSGTDEAATVASYRAIKALAPRSECELRVMLMGSEPEAADRAFTRIERASASILDQPLTYAGCVPRIDAPRATTIYRGPTDEPLERVLDLIHETPATPRADRLVPMPPVDPTPPPTRPAPAEPASHTREPSPARSVAHPMRLVDQLAALSRIDLACPHAPGVELASDASGRLHLLAQDESPARALEALAIARAWARTNSQLLLAAAGALSGPIDPAEHLFVAQPAPVRHLLDTPVRVHLLTAVTVDDQQAWCCVALN